MSWYDHRRSRPNDVLRPRTDHGRGVNQRPRFDRQRRRGRDNAPDAYRPNTIEQATAGGFRKAQNDPDDDDPDKSEWRDNSQCPIFSVVHRRSWGTLELRRRRSLRRRQVAPCQAGVAAQTSGRPLPRGCSDCGNRSPLVTNAAPRDPDLSNEDRIEWARPIWRVTGSCSRCDNGRPSGLFGRDDLEPSRQYRRRRQLHPGRAAPFGARRPFRSTPSRVQRPDVVRPRHEGLWPCQRPNE
jgi:hypothetical protein